MKSILRYLLLVALAALGVWLWFVLFPGPEKVIRHRLTELARAASFSAADGDLARLAGARNLAAFFSTNVEVNIDVPGHVRHTFVGREEITQAALVARSTAGGLSVKFPDITLTLDPDKQTATADLTVEAKATGESDLIVQEMKFTLQKTDGRWLITRVETVKTLSLQTKSAGSGLLCRVYGARLGHRPAAALRLALRAQPRSLKAAHYQSADSLVRT